MEKQRIKRMVSKHLGKSKEIINRDDFAGLMQELKTAFPNLQFPKIRLEYLYNRLNYIDSDLLKTSINKIIGSVENITNNTNLVVIIKRYLGYREDYRKILGWECSKCYNINSLSNDICECEQGYFLSLEEKEETIRKLRKLGICKVADRLEGKLLKEKKTYEQEEL